MNDTCIVNNSTAPVIETNLYASIGCSITVLIIFTNTLILASVVKFPNLRLTSNILIANLAISDLSVGVLLVPYNIVTVLHPQVTDTKYGCVFKLFTWVFCIGSAVIAVCIMSIDRLVALTFPLRYKVVDTKLVAYIVCGISWLAWILFSSIAFFAFTTYHCTRKCTVAVVMPKVAFQITAFMLGICLVFSGIAFIIIIRILCNFDSRNPRVGNREEKKRSIVVALVFGLFILFLVPLISSAVYASNVKQIENRLLVEWLVLLASINSAANGFIYGLKRSEFRNAYLEILRCKGKNRVAPLSQVTNTSVKSEDRRSNVLSNCVTDVSTSKQL